MQGGLVLVVVANAVHSRKKEQESGTVGRLRRRTVR
jgi:hypothetical protein